MADVGKGRVGVCVASCGLEQVGHIHLSTENSGLVLEKPMYGSKCQAGMGLSSRRWYHELVRLSRVLRPAVCARPFRGGGGVSIAETNMLLWQDLAAAREAPRLADIEFLDIFGGEELGAGDGAAYFVIGHRVCDK